MIRVSWFVVLAVVLPAFPVMAAPGDAAVLQARQAYVARQTASLDRAAREVPADHVLLPYVEFWRLMLAGRNEDARIADFLARYPDSRVAETMRADWLKSLGAREAWPLYLAEYPRLVKPEVVHQCYAYRAEWAQGNRSRQREAVALWFTGRDMPSACTPLFERLSEAGLISREDAWRRLRLALEAGKLDLGRRADREIALYALDQLARLSSGQAEQALHARASQFTEEERGIAWARLATWAARRHESAALSWFQQAGGAATNDFQREWWARAALRAGDWQAVQQAIGSMGEATRAQPVWLYWHGRALQATGKRENATPIFLELSRELHYYGQLAQEELGPVMQAPAGSNKASSDDVANVARQPGIARALALYELGVRGDASREWSWAIQGFSDAQLLAAAELARREEWYDRAIDTAERTREQHDLELRFLAPYRELAKQAARDNQIDEALVFGLMRQESRFVSVAQSSVGASGLMQIMPTTARWIARQLGIKRFHPREMQDPAKNIRFGAYYLKHVQNTLDGSPVLATAAYNAGPSRAQRWRDAQQMEAAVYIESIPFAETRDYVKKVMSNAMYYAARFGQPSVLLKDRLGTVQPRKNTATAAPEPKAVLELGRAGD